MLEGVPAESRWAQPQPRRTLPKGLLLQIVRRAFPSCRLLDVQPLTGGLRNANFKLRLDATPEFAVLRIYEHDASLCRKETDLIKLVGPSVPVPQIIHAEPAGWNEIPPFALFSYVEGISFSELKRCGDPHAIAQSARDVGRTLASIGRTAFPKPGWLGPGPEVTAPLLEGPNPEPRFVDLCLASAEPQGRMDAELRDRTSAFIWSYERELASLGGERTLVHGDFGNRNLLVREVDGKWKVAAVLDWEFAVSGSPLNDVGHFLRYECASRPVVEPHFSEAYSDAGGKLPHDWRRLARVLDLMALCESLTHQDLPCAAAAELIELVRATLENRPPRLNW